jgi:cob(I)alamin adenosyltransferase
LREGRNEGRNEEAVRKAERDSWSFDRERGTHAFLLFLNRTHNLLNPLTLCSAFSYSCVCGKEHGKTQTKKQEE